GSEAEEDEGEAEAGGAAKKQDTESEVVAGEKLKKYFARNGARLKYFFRSPRKNDSLCGPCLVAVAPPAASNCSSAASSTASVQYARLFSGLPAPRRDLS